MRISTEQLLGELIDRWALGHALEVEELLGRAGPQADELAELIDAFLVRAPRREPTQEALAAVRALAEPPLLRARQARGLKLDDLAGGLVERLGLPADARAKVRRHYQNLELGRLDPGRVAASVWAALAELLQRDARRLAGPVRPLPATPAMYRAATIRPMPSEPIVPPAVPHAVSETDEVDRLFGL